MHFTVSLTALKHKKCALKLLRQIFLFFFFKCRKYDKAVWEDSSSLQYVPDWFITREWVDMWYDDYYDDDGGHWNDDNDEDKFFE